MNKSWKRLLGQIASKTGYTIVPNWRLERLPQAEFLSKLFSYLSIDCVFDVGANEGQFGEFLRHEVGYEGWIVSFEPIPSCVAALQKRISNDPRWIIEAYALGRKPGNSRLNVMASNRFSSFLTPDHSNTSLFKKSNYIVEEIEVSIRTLELELPRLISTTGCSSLYLKLDTQGFDVEVGIGAGALISRFRALQTEASVKPIYDGAPTFVEAIRSFNDMGFDLGGIFPNNPSHFPQMIEFDCHMINRDFVGRKEV